ncbi:EAL domain-containing response regulator [Roseiterribacter gracilis]|uniref:Diguanylate phosphodiesterase n=1 Tax=Roseiterribacter gracilis TaxID=2812848 RepID=A0A8S8X907_9PROT|nr:diguanylate phosphodiesterase [Rhodospirillales bacterium TMPK1]
MRLIALDDELIMLRLVELLAMQSGAETRTTTDPELFLSLVREWAPDYALVDLQMPNLDGLQVLRELAELRSSAVVVLMSAFEPKVLNVAQSIGKSLGLTMGPVLQKPITASNFARALEQPVPPRALTGIDALSLAIDRGELVLHWQPILDLETNRITGMEALCRWQHPDQGLVFPDAFIPLAETSGMSQRLSAWVLNAAFSQAAQWARVGVKPIVAINVSPEAFEAAEFVDVLEALRAEHGLSADQICLELTESSAARNPTRLRESISRLRLRNYHVALDDFGTGTSTLQQIQALPCTELKIDKSFVLQMAHSEEASAIVRSILALASALDVKVIAEGVENEEVAGILQAGGCQMGQGYFFARPMPADRATDLLCSRVKAQSFCSS